MLFYFSELVYIHPHLLNTEHLDYLNSLKYGDVQIQFICVRRVYILLMFCTGDIDTPIEHEDLL